MEQVFVYPGQLHGTVNHATIKTILGSCVSVVMYDAERGIAGLNHYLLTKSNEGESQNGRYGDFAIRALYEKLMQLGASKANLKAQIFGGAAVEKNLKAAQFDIGQRNIEYARTALKSYGIEIVHEDIGGQYGRQIEFNTESLEVKVTSKNKNTNLSGSEQPVQKSKIKVLVIDDSATVRSILTKVLTRDERLEVVGSSPDPYDARKKIVALKPDVLTLDIEMPRMNGVHFLQKVMEHLPLPVIMVSSLQSQGAAAQKALELGALEFVHKPSQFDPAVLSQLAEDLIPKVVAASTVDMKAHLSGSSKPVHRTTDLSSAIKTSKAELICVGGNSGAPGSLVTLLKTIAHDTPPIVVAVPTIAAFIGSFIDRIKGLSSITLEQVDGETTLNMGRCYLISEANHMQVEKNGSALRLVPATGSGTDLHKPSSDLLFKSAASTCGEGCLGMLLSGIGSAGVEGLTSLRDGGAVTLVESPESATFGFLPNSAIEAGAAEMVLSSDSFSEFIERWRSDVANNPAGVKSA